VKSLLAAAAFLEHTSCSVLALNVVEGSWPATECFASGQLWIFEQHMRKVSALDVCNKGLRMQKFSAETHSLCF
jgi:hypothetical protein